jgi:hypothetical protein
VVRITDGKIYTDDALAVHVVHGIGAAATDADYFDDGRFSLWEIDFHNFPIYWQSVPAGG